MKDRALTGVIRDQLGDPRIEDAGNIRILRAQIWQRDSVASCDAIQ
jgi:hypothetical protein